jgi:hypothetical protein
MTVCINAGYSRYAKYAIKYAIKYAGMLSMLYGIPYTVWGIHFIAGNALLLVMHGAWVPARKEI